ncbi:MAG: hypothetical protein IKB64_00620 [Paludibacteraceae bacterium]|nr:hypothetical protein [Paludibacteraceae bacterium]
MGLEVCPCKGCTTETGRSQTCHSNCERYIKWKRKLDEINAARRKQADMEAALWNYKKRHK